MRWWCWLIVMLTASPILAAPREYSCDLWDWTAPCRDLPTFKIWANDLKSIGVNRIEISAPWNLLEPEAGKYDLSFIADRLAVAKQLGLGLRIRINSYYGGATPVWLKADKWCDIKGNSPQGTPQPVSINDPRFWERFAPLCTEIAKKFRGEDIYYNPFIGVHAELKWADWWTYDPSSLKLWREATKGSLPEIPPIPPATNGKPETSAASLAFITFREQCWREAVRRFNEAIHAGDPNARTSAPLGESFRSESARFSNQDYFGLSRGCEQVVHSYDFYWHPKDGAWYAGAAVASFHGITKLPVVFEFDGPDLMERLGYDEKQLLEIADAAIEQGAGIKIANYSYSTKLPSAYPILKAFAERIAKPQATAEPLTKETIIIFVSKWANYCYRDKTQWLHDAQFGAWKMLRDRGESVRFICEDNLEENLSGYKGVYVAYSPPQLVWGSAGEKLEKLTGLIPSIVELTNIPAKMPATEMMSDFAVSGHKVVIGAPLAYAWLKGADRKHTDDVLGRAIDASWGRAAGR